MRYLLNTNIVFDLVRHPQGRVTQRIREVGEAQVCTSIIVAAELRYGAAKRGLPRLAAQLEVVLGALEVLPFEAPADQTYGRLRARLERAGQPIGANDLLIAGIRARPVARSNAPAGTTPSSSTSSPPPNAIALHAPDCAQTHAKLTLKLGYSVGPGQLERSADRRRRMGC